MTNLKKGDGLKILAFIEETLNIKLPRTGVLAGQSVCSAILYLSGSEKEFHVNDLDIFHMNYGNLNYFLKTDNEIPVIGKGSLFNMELRYNDEKRKKEVNDNNAKIREMFNSGEISIEDYNKLTLKHDYQRQVKSLIFNTPQTSYNKKYNYDILRVYRRELLNHIIVDSRANDINNVIFGFDINSTQVGINLTTGELVFSRHFVDFLRTGQMRLTSLDRPHHSIIRYLSKRKEFGYKGNDEHEVLAISLALHMSNDDTSKYIEERMFDNKHKDLDTDKFRELRFNRFGNSYLPKLEPVKDKLMDFDLSIEKIENKFYDGASVEFMRKNLTSMLGHFVPRIDLSDCISLDYEIDSAKKILGKNTLGGNRYLFSKAIDIVSKNNGMATEKKGSIYSIPSIKHLLSTKSSLTQLGNIKNSLKRVSSEEVYVAVVDAIHDNESHYSVFDKMFRDDEMDLVLERFNAKLALLDSLDKESILSVLDDSTLTDYDGVSYSDEFYEYKPVVKYSDIPLDSIDNDRIRTFYLSAVLNYNFAWEITDKRNNNEFLYSFSIARNINEIKENFSREGVWNSSKRSRSPSLDLSECALSKKDGTRQYSYMNKELMDSIETFKEWLSDNGYLTKMINCRE